MIFGFFRKKDFGDFPIFLSNNRIFSNSKKGINLAESKKFGETNQGKIIYSPYEALYLTENLNAKLYKNEREISVQKFVKIFSKRNPEFSTNYIAFKDLRKKGYLVKTGSKFGTEFRVSKKSEKHSKWILVAVNENEKLNLKDFVGKNRIAHSTGKKLLIAIIDSQENVNYFETDWLKLR